MYQCSKLAYLKRRPEVQVQGQKFSAEVDTNVVGIGFEILKDVQNKIVQGDPIKCKECFSFLNKFSRVLNAQEYLQINQVEKQEQKNENLSDLDKSLDTILLANIQGKMVEIEENQSAWVCEFCNYLNKITIEKEEIPQQEDVIYLIQSAQQRNEGRQNLNSEQSVILCIDASGSMSQTTEVKGKLNLKHGISAEEYEMLKQFMEPGDEQQMLQGMNKQVTYVSRKQCVIGAIESQVQDMLITNPNKVVGLVTFNNEVVLIGDGQNAPVTITGDRLYNAEEIRTLSHQAAPLIMCRPVKDSSAALLERFYKIEEKGQTALGPALISSLELAKAGKPGSMIIVCTDGLANLGLGSFDTSLGNEVNEVTKSFYAGLALEAKDSGISISVVTIKGMVCGMSVLSMLAEQTNGNVTRVDPMDISKNFASILKDEIVGTQVILIVRVHRAIKFRNEQIVEVDGTLKKDIGNATVNTKVTFEYELRSDQELKQFQVQANDLKEVPFQATIEYTSLQGDRLLRVLTQMVKTTEDLKQAEKNAEVNVIHTRIQQQTAQHVQRGSFQKAREYNDQWGDYVQHNDAINSNQTNLNSNYNFMPTNARLIKVTNQKEMRSEQFKSQDQQKCMKEKKITINKTIVKEEEEEEQPKVGFFQKMFSSPQEQNQKPKIKKQQDSESDEDMEEAEIIQFMQAKN